MAMGQNPKPNRTPSEHPNPTTKIGSKMGGAPTPKWYHWKSSGLDVGQLRLRALKNHVRSAAQSTGAYISGQTCS